MEANQPFWKRKSLTEMTKAEWESLCDGCGWCCMVKLEAPHDTNITYYTDVACRLLDHETCRCSDYRNRSKHFEDCVQITPSNVDKLVFLPPTCGYRLIAEGKDLYWWHHLVSGDRDTVHHAGMSVADRVADSELNVKDDDLDDRIIRSSEDG
jgi:uncharacterized protein